MNRFYLFFMLTAFINGSANEYRAEKNRSNLFYFCTAANEKFYPHLINLIGSIHRHNFYELGEIAVFDLGLLPEQVAFLSTIDKLSIHKVTQTNPDMFKLFYTEPDNSKSAPGWYSWKPVAIKQAFDLFPTDSNILWIDAGTTILKDISILFKSIEYQGYFFHNGWDWPLKRHTTQFLINALNLHCPERQRILGDTTYGLEAGLMGLTQKVYDNFIMPMYEHTKDIRYFADDGTAPEGFGYAHHDQTLFSIYAHLNIFYIINHFENRTQSFNLPISETEQVPFHIASLDRWQSPESSIVCSRNNLSNFEENKSHIYYKNSYMSSLRKVFHAGRSTLFALFKRGSEIILRSWR